MKYGVTIGDYHSLTDWGLHLTALPDITAPEPKTYYVDIPGGNGSLDLTESLNGVAFYDRTLSFSLGGKLGYGEWTQKYSEVLDAIHGKELKLVFDRDSDYYYKGRVTVGKLTYKTPFIASFPVEVLVSPFKWEPESVSYTGMFTSADVAAAVRVPLTGEVVSKQSWNTDMRFGTATIPTVDFSMYLSIECTYTYYSSAWHNLQFVDGNGSVYNTTLQTGGTTTVTIATLQNAGLDPSSIYRILMSGGGSGSVAVYTKNSVTMTVEGSSKTSVPVINCTSGIEAVTLNGNTSELSAGLNYVEDLVLTSGENVLIFTGGFDTATIVVSYQRGWL